MAAPTVPQHPQRRSPGDLIVIALFALLLAAPALLALTGHAGFDTAFLMNNEQRRPFVAPPVTTGALATGGWERDFERQLADEFPLRKYLIEGYDFAKYTWLRDSTTPLVILGRDGWAFLGGDERDYLGGAPSDAVVAHIADVYAARSRWCARRGIAYVFLLAPNKSTIYPQYLPRGITPAAPSGADRLVRRLRALGVRVADPRAELHAAAVRGDVYTHNDTHWNDAGAYLAYRTTLAALRGVRVGAPLDPAVLQPRIDVGDGDLLRLSGVSGLVTNRWLHYDFPRRSRDVDAPVDAGDPALAKFAGHVTVIDGSTWPKAVIFGDSFSEQVRPFFGESFRRVVNLHHFMPSDPQFDTRFLEKEQPDVVIQQLVERGLVSGAVFKP
jgi:alginate O-acetyltransferase complex protein AlgJ